MKHVGISCSSVDSYKYTDGQFNITGDSLEARWLSEAFDRHLRSDERGDCQVFGSNEQRRLVFEPSTELDLAVHLNHRHTLATACRLAAKTNVLYFQNAYEDYTDVFKELDTQYQAVMFHSPVIHQRYLDESGKLPSMYLPFATEPGFFMYEPYPRQEKDVCYVGSSITRNADQYERVFRPLLDCPDLDFVIGGRFVGDESLPELESLAHPLSPEDVRDLYRQSSIGLVTVHPFDVQNMVIPSRVYDLMACGTLILIEDHAYLREFLGRSGVYFTDNVVDMARLMLSLEDMMPEESAILASRVQLDRLSYSDRVYDILNFLENNGLWR